MVTGGMGTRTLGTLSLCSGYGGLEMGLRLAEPHLGVSFRTVCYVEREAHAQACLVARMEDATLDRAPVWDDVATFDARPWRGKVDLITAGFPCQPWSAAGKKQGTDDSRWLWPAIAKVVRDVEPSYVFLENVRGITKGGMEVALGDLASLGFDAEWDLLAAADVGASHKRERWWCFAWRTMADPEGARGQQVPRSAPRDEATDGRWEDQTDELERGGKTVGHAKILTEREPRHGSTTVTRSDARQQSDCPGERSLFPPGPDDHDGWTTYLNSGGPAPAVRGGTDGSTGRVDRLSLAGNGVVPLVVATALCRLVDRADLVL